MTTLITTQDTTFISILGKKIVPTSTFAFPEVLARLVGASPFTIVFSFKDWKIIEKVHFAFKARLRVTKLVPTHESFFNKCTNELIITTLCTKPVLGLNYVKRLDLSLL